MVVMQRQEWRSLLNEIISTVVAFKIAQSVRLDVLVVVVVVVGG